MKYKTILVYEYNKRFLVVDGGSGLRIISVYGTPFPTGTTNLDNSYLCEAAIIYVWVPGATTIALFSKHEIWPRQ